MAVSTTNTFSGPYTTNGVTTVFPFTFTAPTVSEVAVMLRDSDGVETSVNSGDFTVTLTDGGGGSVTFDTAPATGDDLFVLLNPVFTQEIEFENGSAWLAAPVNEANDRSAARDQYLKALADRSFKLPLGEVAPAAPSIDGVVNKVLGMAPVTGMQWFDPSELGATGAPGGNVLSVGLFTAIPGITVPAGTDLIQTSGFSTSGKGMARYSRWIAGMTALDPALEGISWQEDLVGEKFFISEALPNLYQFGALGGNTGDDSTAINNAMLASKPLRIPADTFLATGLLRQQEGQALFGLGKGLSIIKAVNATPAAEEWLFSGNGFGGTMIDFALFGGLDSNKTAQVATGNMNGGRFDWNQEQVQHGFKAHGFSGTGIGTGALAGGRACSSALTDVHSYNNWCNFEFGPNAAEYITLNGCRGNSGRYGALISSGNVVGAANHFGDNYIGLRLLGTAIGNDGHGSLVGSTFNHNTYAVWATDIKHGFNLNGSMAFYGIIYFERCSAITMNGGILSVSSCNFEGGGRNEVCGNKLQVVPGTLPCDMVHNYNGVASNTKTIDNWRMDLNTLANEGYYGSPSFRSSVVVESPVGSGMRPTHLFGEPGSVKETHGAMVAADSGTGTGGLFPWIASVLGAKAFFEWSIFGATSGKLTNMRTAFPAYADNAAALAGGLAAGDCYTTATGEQRVVV